MKLFTTKDCGRCQEVKRLLDEAEIQYAEFDMMRSEGICAYCMIVEAKRELPLLVDPEGCQWAGRAAVVRAERLLNAQRYIERSEAAQEQADASLIQE